MLRIAIVEDNALHCQQLTEHLRRYEEENKLTFEIDSFVSGIHFFEDYTPRWDVIFLDIDMPGTDGMSVAEDIRRSDTGVVLIFVTNLTHYAIKGYAVNAMDYILKPINYTSFCITLNKVVQHYKNITETFINLKLKNGIRKISLNSIYYVEVLNHYLTYHTFEGDFTIRGTFASAEKELSEQFAKCNSCYLVNLKYVKFVNKENVQIGPYTLPISRRSYLPFLETLNRYLGKKGT